MFSTVQNKYINHPKKEKKERLVMHFPYVNYDCFNFLYKIECMLEGWPCILNMLIRTGLLAFLCHILLIIHMKSSFSHRYADNPNA